MVETVNKPTASDDGWTSVTPAVTTGSDDWVAATPTPKDTQMGVMDRVLTAAKIGLESTPMGQAVAGSLEGFGYKPTSMAGKAIGAVAKIPEQVGEYLGGKTAEKVTSMGGAPEAAGAAGAAVKTGIEAIPMMLPTPAGKGKVIEEGIEKGIEALKNPALRAKRFVTENTGLVWDSLSAEMRAGLTQVAKDAKNLQKLDPKALEREALLQGVGVTKYTKGQVTREPLQQRKEQLTRAVSEGNDLRAMDIENNRILTDNIKSLRGSATAEGSVQVGQSVQGVLRTRFDKTKKMVRRLYKEAESAGETEAPVPVDRLVQYLTEHDDPSQVQFVKDRLKMLGVIQEETTGGITVSQNKPLTLKQLEGIYKAAGARGKAGGTQAHYAREVKDIINDMTEGLGGEKYQAARAARKQMGDEFERTNAVAQLVRNRKMSTDRATKLEDTWRKTVLNGGVEDLIKVQKMLEKTDGGQQALADLRGATADYIYSKATGGGQLGLKNEAGDVHATWDGMRRAVQDIGQDKLELIFGVKGAKFLNDTVEAAQILKTEAPTGVKGSPSFEKLLTYLDSLAKVPGLGSGVDLAVAGVKGAKKLIDVGKAGREARAAIGSPLQQAAKPSIGKTARQTLESLTDAQRKRAAGAALTLAGMEQSQ